MSVCPDNNEMTSGILAIWLNLIIPRSSPKVEVIGQSSRSHDENVPFSAMRGY